MHTKACPYCDWTSDPEDFKGLAMLKFYDHLGDTPTCAAKFEADAKAGKV